jgi:TRAP-type mannitol/chloroaromatic compound transport system substrate-binding protein
MMAKYDAQNPPALRRLVGSGTKLRPFPKAVMEASEKAAYELYGELMAKSEHWKRIYPQWKKFRDEEFLWFRVGRVDLRQLQLLLEARCREIARTSGVAPST